MNELWEFFRHALGPESAASYVLTRFVFQRALALVYLSAFAILVNQGLPLLGSHGLLPIPSFLSRAGFWDAPSVFHAHYSDTSFQTLAWLGLALSLFAASGLSDSLGMAVSALTWFSLWAIYRSFVSVGQTFWGFGWEMLLLETGFLAIFLGSRDTQPPVVVIWMLRWLCFRVMFGAGLIKIRGDECWRDLTCMVYHYETQPLPGPLSWCFHMLPRAVHRIETFITHVIELPVPFFMLAPWPALRAAGGLLTIGFQVTLMFSGNLSWLNCITIVTAISCFNDRQLLAALGAVGAAANAVVPEMAWARVAVLGALGLVIFLLSIKPTLNLLSPNQAMNAGFDPLGLVNTYGAFGSVTRERYEIVLEGTDEPVLSPSTKWRAYEFKGKPGDPTRRPPQVTPYHYKIDWQMWFAAMGSYRSNPWLLNLVAKLLRGDSGALSLIRASPFPEKPPRFIRAQLYLYKFASSEERSRGLWWHRSYVEPYLPPLSLDEPEFRSILKRMGWES